jgi:hypothetical protein
MEKIMGENDSKQFHENEFWKAWYALPKETSIIFFLRMAS